MSRGRPFAVVAALLAALITLASPAGAATSRSTLAAATAKPVISSFTATLGSSTSTKTAPVTLKVKAEHSSTCRVSVTPAVTGLPKSIACVAGNTAKEFSTVVAVPLNRKPTAVKYVFAVAVSGPGGTATATAASPVVMRDVMPVMKTLLAVAGTTTPAGTPVTISATTLRATSCTFRVTPAVAGLPATGAACATARQVTIPPNTTGAAETFTFTGTALNKYGSSSVRKSVVTIAAAAVKPQVSSFTATPGTPSGGNVPVDLEATVANATSCTFSVTPSVAGLPTTVDCSNGAASGPSGLAIPETATAQTYGFSLSVTGPGGTTTAGPLDVSIPAAEGPGITGLTASYASESGTGDVYDVTATVGAGATGCTLVVTGPGFSQTDTPTCTGSDPTQPATVSDSITLPFNASGSAVTYTADLQATGAKGTSDDTTPISVGQQSAATLFNTPGTIDPTSGMPSGISCVSSTWCMAMDYTGETFVWNGSEFTQEPSIYNDAAGMPTDPFTLSCASSTYCVAGDWNGWLYTWNGTSWSQTVQVQDSSGSPQEVWAVSCPTTTFCGAFSNLGVAWYWNGTTWSAGDAVPLFISAASCVSDGKCQFIANSQLTDGTSTTNFTGFGAEHVSCASDSSCVATGEDGYGNSYTTSWNGATWSSPVALATGEDMRGVSCAPGATVFCVAVGDSGHAFTYDGSSWSAPVLADPGYRNTGNELGGVSCPAVDSCVAYDEWGSAVALSLPAGSTSPSWSAPIAFDLGSYSPTSVSCGDISWCVGVGAFEATQYDGNLTSPDKWSRPLEIDPTNVLNWVSCAPGTRFCMAVDDGGNALSYSNGTWSAPQEVGGMGSSLLQVSCPTATFCVTFDEISGMVYTWDGSTWSGTLVDPSNGSDSGSPASISCPSDSFCELVDTYGNAFSWTPSTGWSTAQPLPQATPSVYTVVSCSSQAFCMVANPSGQYWVIGDGQAYLGSTGDQAGTLSSGLQSLSCPQDGVCVGTSELNNSMLYVNGTWQTGAAPALASGNELLTCEPGLEDFCMAWTSTTSSTWSSGWWSVYPPGEAPAPLGDRAATRRD